MGYASIFVWKTLWSHVSFQHSQPSDFVLSAKWEGPNNLYNPFHSHWWFYFLSCVMLFCQSFFLRLKCPTWFYFPCIWHHFLLLVLHAFALRANFHCFPCEHQSCHSRQNPSAPWLCMMTLLPLISWLCFSVSSVSEQCLVWFLTLLRSPFFPQ